MKPLNQFPKLQTFSELVESLLRNRDPNLTQNEHVYAICCRPEVADVVLSSENIKTIVGYAVLNIEVASISSIRDIQKNPFATTEAAADIDNSIKRKRIRVSFKYVL